MSEEETIVFENGEMSAKIRVRRATLLDGVKRTRLSEEAKLIEAKMTKRGEGDVDRWILRVMVWPDVAACTSGVLNFNHGGTESTEKNQEILWPPDFESFANLTDELGVKVQDAVYRVNPHWAPESAAPATKKEVEVKKKNRRADRVAEPVHGR
jgi:hypothetical protein